MFCLLLDDCCFLSNNYPILGFHHLLSLPFLPKLVPCSLRVTYTYSELQQCLWWGFLCGKKLSTAGCQILLPVFYLTSTLQGRPWLRLGIKLQSFWVLHLSRKFTEALGWETVMPWLSFNGFSMYLLRFKAPNTSSFTADLRTVSAKSIKCFHCRLVQWIHCSCFLCSRGGHRWAGQQCRWLGGGDCWVFYQWRNYYPCRTRVITKTVVR